MIDMACGVWTSATNTTGTWDKQHIANLREKGADCYYRRVKSLIDHTSATAPSTSEKKRLSICWRSSL